MSDIVLETIALTKNYGSLTAVKSLSLKVYEGEIFGFLGPNGAGKTTSLNMMCGLLKPDSGEVLLHGAPIRGTDAKLRQDIGMCPQNIVVWEKLTCLEQLQFIGEMYGMNRKTARQSGEKLLDTLDLSEKCNKLANTLSGGMRRRLSLALALVHDPEIIVLDEPEAGLDPQSRVKVRDYIRSLARKKTVILTTHNMDEADRLADRIAIIDHGELLVLDTPEALKQSVGEGDVLEVELLPTPDGNGCESAEKALGSLNGLWISCSQNHLILRALNIINMLPAILEALSSSSLNYSDVHLRENSLEDVFIKLTGRRLRE